MSKNQKTYLLLFAVALVWGAIGYQFYKGYNPDVPEIAINTSSRFTPEKYNKQASYTINPEYRDPFTGKLYRKPVKIKKKSTPKPQVVFPAILYKGVITGSKKSYIISIGGNSQIFQMKQTISGVTLIKESKKSITVKYQNETRKYSLVE